MLVSLIILVTVLVTLYMWCQIVNLENKVEKLEEKK